MRSIREQHFVKDIVLISIILSIPFLFFSYNLAPFESSSWKTSLFEIHAGEYEDITYFLWLLSVKVYTILIIIVWYVTCKNFWKYCLFLPLSFEINSLFYYLNIRFRFIEDFSFLYSLPIILIIFSIIILMSRHFTYESSIKGVYAEINSETESLIKIVSKYKDNNYKSLKKELTDLRKMKPGIAKCEYLKELIIIRDKLIIEDN